MICGWCSLCAELKIPGRVHTSYEVRSKKISCPEGTWCDCQHKDPGTGINRELVKDA